MASGRWSSATARAAALAALASALITTGQSRAANDTCLTAYENTQLWRRAGDVRAARGAARQCARAECSEALRNECLTWLSEIDREVPSLVFRAQLGGKDLSAVRVFLDGEKVADSLDGHPVEVDPGQHRIRMDLGTGESREQTVIVAIGEKNRIVSQTFDPPGSEPSPAGGPHDGAVTSAPSIRAIVGYSLIGLGAVGVGVGTAFAFMATNKKSSAEAQCRNSVCLEASQPLIEDQRSYATVADVGIFAGATFLLTGVGLLLWPKLGPSQSVQVTSTTQGLGVRATVSF